MAAFDIMLVPTTIASSATPDTETGMNVIYDAAPESDWSPTGASTALKTINAVYCDWNTAALASSSRQLGLSNWVLSTDGVTTNTAAIAATSTISGISIMVAGTNSVVSLDFTECTIFAAIKEKFAAGGIVTPLFLGNPQFIDALTIISNGGLGPGSYPFSGEIVGSNGALAGLSAANLLTALRASTLFLEMIIQNEYSTTFDLKMDRIAIRVTGDDGLGDSTWRGGRTMVRMPGGGWAACKSRIRGKFAQ